MDDGGGHSEDGQEPDPVAREYSGAVHQLRLGADFAEVHRGVVQAIERPFALREQVRYPRLSVGRFRGVRLLLQDEGEFDGDPVLLGIGPEWTAAVRAWRRGGELVVLFANDSEPGTLVRVAYLSGGDAALHPDGRGLSLARELCGRTRALLAKAGIEEIDQHVESSG